MSIPYCQWGLVNGRVRHQCNCLVSRQGRTRPGARFVLSLHLLCRKLGFSAFQWARRLTVSWREQVPTATLYLHLKNEEAVFGVHAKMEGHKVADGKGKEHKVLVEYAPFLKVPRRKVCRLPSPESDFFLLALGKIHDICPLCRQTTYPWHPFTATSRFLALPQLLWAPH